MMEEGGRREGVSFRGMRAEKKEEVGGRWKKEEGVSLRT
jgi:hypothetical protein